MPNCKKCGHKTILATGTIQQFLPDQEPYESDKIEDCGFDTIYEIMSVMIYWCPKCKEIVESWIEEK